MHLWLAGTTQPFTSLISSTHWTLMTPEMKQWHRVERHWHRHCGMWSPQVALDLNLSSWSGDYILALILDVIGLERWDRRGEQRDCVQSAHYSMFKSPIVAPSPQKTKLVLIFLEESVWGRGSGWGEQVRYRTARKTEKPNKPPESTKTACQSVDWSQSVDDLWACCEWLGEGGRASWDVIGWWWW